MKKVKPKEFDFAQFKYRRPFIFPFESRTRLGLSSPVRQMNKGFLKNRNPDLAVLCAAIGLDSEENKPAIAIHNKRYIKYGGITEIISFIFYVLLGALFFVGIAIIFDLIFGKFHIFLAIPGTPAYGLTQVAVYILFLMVIYLALQIADRIAAAILDPLYADTLSFETCLYLIIQISKEETFRDSKDKIIAIKRARALKRNIILLAFQFDITNEAVLNHIENMALLLEDIEKQLILSTPKTRQKLLEILNRFARVLLSKHYGDFGKITNVKTIVKNSGIQRKTIFRKVIDITGIVIPIALLLLLLLNPASIQIIGLNTSLVFLGSLIWILLFIDAKLNMGIVDKLIDVSRALREFR